MESVEWERVDGETLMSAIALWRLGRIEHRARNLDRASAILEEALDESRRFGFKTNIVSALGTLGLVALEQGDAIRAATLYAEALALCRETGDRVVGIECLEGAGETALALCRPERAARLIGAADALRGRLMIPIPPVDRPCYDRTLAAIREAVSVAAFAAAWVEGKALTMEQALALALDETAPS